MNKVVNARRLDITHVPLGPVCRRGVVVLFRNNLILDVEKCRVTVSSSSGEDCTHYIKATSQST